MNLRLTGFTCRGVDSDWSSLYGDSPRRGTGDPGGRLRSLHNQQQPEVYQGQGEGGSSRLQYSVPAQQ